MFSCFPFLSPSYLRPGCYLPCSTTPLSFISLLFVQAAAGRTRPRGRCPPQGRIGLWVPFSSPTLYHHPCNLVSHKLLCFSVVPLCLYYEAVFFLKLYAGSRRAAEQSSSMTPTRFRHRPGWKVEDGGLGTDCSPLASALLYTVSPSGKLRENLDDVL